MVILNLRGCVGKGTYCLVRSKSAVKGLSGVGMQVCEGFFLKGLKVENFVRRVGKKVRNATFLHRRERGKSGQWWN